MELIQAVTRRQGTITLIALHDLNLAARYGDRLLLLKDGRIAADVPPQHVLGSDWLSEAYGVDVDLVPARESRLLVDARLCGRCPRRGWTTVRVGGSIVGSLSEAHGAFRDVCFFKMRPGAFTEINYNRPEAGGRPQRRRCTFSAVPPRSRGVATKSPLKNHHYGRYGHCLVP